MSDERGPPGGQGGASRSEGPREAGPIPTGTIPIHPHPAPPAPAPSSPPPPGTARRHSTQPPPPRRATQPAQPAVRHGASPYGHPPAPPHHTPNPYQSQVVPQSYPYPRTGAAPAATASAPRVVSGAFAAPRITVQYPQVGTTLASPRGSYVVQNVIGSGEFGAVYECIGPFDQIYALKMVRPANRPYNEVQAEWAREQQRLFSLRHPNVVYIYDSFEQGHLYYLALERCDHALKAMLGSPMSEGLVLEITRQLLAAVQFLHDNDVVHDDLHAGNVLITHTDRPTVKISDFGISHELRGMTAIRPNIVHHAIMAPEILATGYTSKQSDLYQVGLLMYWMVTGQPAMDTGVPYQDLVRQVSDGEPRRRAEMLGTPIGALIAKMLRRREAFRYTSAREVWADLRELPAWRARQLFPAK